MAAQQMEYVPQEPSTIQQTYQQKAPEVEMQQQYPMQQQQPNAYGGAYPTGVHPDIAQTVADEQDYEDKMGGGDKGRDDDLSKRDRKQFVIKVYAICSTQLLITVLACVASITNLGGVQDFMKEFYWLSYIAIGIGIVLFCVLACSKEKSRKVPLNYILLFAFTLAWSWMVAGFVIWYTPESVLMCTALVMFMFVALTLYACFTKEKHLQWCWAMGAVLGFCIWPAFIFAWMFPSKMGYIGLYLLIAVLTSIYIVYDTKMIMTKFGCDEYIIAALMLYVDIIQLFIMILSICGGR